MSSRRDLANAIRALSMDAVQRAKSGHPGMPMGMADLAEVLWNDFLRHNPGNPQWANRDRFVLSNGHGSMLLYSLLHLTGYGLPMEEIENFRQLHSMTPGHPEYGDTPGVETTTGPLGQGLANAVGMAIAEKVLAAQFNRENHPIVDHNTYVFVGDGCLMEGISHEASSLAGTLGLGKLIVFYDDNGISIDGEVKDWYTDDTPARFRAYGWQVLADVDGHDPEAVKSAIEAARANGDAPTLICCKTIIGWGSPNKQGKASSHGAALGEDEVARVRETIGWPHAPFHIPEDIAAAWDGRVRGQALEDAWTQGFDAYRDAYPELAAEFQRRMAGALPRDWSAHADSFIHAVQEAGENIASRKASQNAIESYAPLLPELIGGSADLAGSNLTLHSGSRAVSADSGDGNYLYFGVREFAMSAMMNGLTLHGGFIPYGATFLTFSEYARNALRMAALMGIRSIFVYTHDSIGLGEDGPTHQAVEQTATLRLIPNMTVWRPCDGVESAIAWRHAIERGDGPSCLLFSRQGLRHHGRTAEQLADTARGGYVLRDCADAPRALIIATGSEVGMAVEASDMLAEKGIPVRVVSMPCTDVFDAQSPAFRESVLPAAVKARVSVEAGVTDCWHKYIGGHGRAIGVDSFGLSAPYELVYEHFGLTAQNVVRAVEDSIASCVAETAGVAAE